MQEIESLVLPVQGFDVSLLQSQPDSDARWITLGGADAHDGVVAHPAGHVEDFLCDELQGVVDLGEDFFLVPCPQRDRR